MLAALAAVVTAWALRPIWNIDVWWHVALGRWILAHGLPSHDVLSAVPRPGPWTTFQGGYEVFVALLDRFGGLFAVRLVHALAVGAGMALAARTARRQGAAGSEVVVLVALLLVLYEDRIRVRPHVFHFAFTWVMLPLAVAPDRRMRWRDLAWTVPLVAVWQFFHAPGSLWGLLLLGVAALREPRNRAGVAALGAAALTLAALPGVGSSLVSALRVHTTGHLQAAYVPEHWPLWAYPRAGLGVHGWVVPAVCVGLLAAGAAAARRAQTASRAHRLGLWGLLGAYATTAIALARLAWHAGAVAAATRATRSGPVRLVAVAAVLLFAADAAVYVAPRYRHIDPWTTDVQPGRFPEGPAEVLRRAHIGGRIFNEPGWGGFLAYHLFPAARTLTDGRIAFGPQVAALLRRWDDGERAAVLDEAAERFDLDVAVVRPFRGGKPRRWKLVFRDAVAELWLRRDARLPSRLARLRTVQERWGH